MRTAVVPVVSLTLALTALAQSSSHDPTWWDKFLFLANNGPDSLRSTVASRTAGTNVDVSNECGPQSETFIAINPSNPNQLAAGSNEIFRLPMRAFFSSDGGKTWGGADVPLPPSIGTNGFDFGSDPGVAFDSSNNLFYSFIVVFFANGIGQSIKGTEMAVARSTDGGRTWPQVAFFDFNGGTNHFNDKPMITADANLNSPFRDSIYVAWDAASGGSPGGGVRFGRSRDHGATFTTRRIDDPNGPGRSIGATVTTGPDGQLYVAWNDIAANTITFNSSFDGGVTFGTPRVIAAKAIPFDIAIPAEFNRRALVYPACDVDRTAHGPFRGRITCAWMDLTPDGQNTDIFASFSDDQGATWASRFSVAESLGGVDRFTTGSRLTRSPGKSTSPTTTRATTPPAGSSKLTCFSRGLRTACTSHPAFASPMRGPTSTTAMVSFPARASTTATNKATTRASLRSAASCTPSGRTAGATRSGQGIRAADAAAGSWRRSLPRH